MSRPRLGSTLLALAAICLAPAPARAIDCSRDSVGLVPIDDLGTASYQGVQGGLYAGGSNHRPAGHNATGVAFAEGVGPLDTLGMPDSTNGRVVLISIGMSNTTFEFSRFVPKAMSFAHRSPYLEVLDCAEGGQSADRIVNPSAAYWDTVAARLRARRSSPAQGQAAWAKEAIAGPTGTFPASMDTLRRDLATIAALLKLKLPHLKLCYLTSRIYAGYATTPLN